MLAAVVLRGADAVERTPELLDVLRNAGVVDAGGAGLLEIVRGIAAVARGRAASRGAARGGACTSTPSTRSSRGTATARSSSSRATASTARRSRQQLEPLGDSLLVVGDPTALKVHVHTDEPGAALALGTAVGTLEQVEIANMHKQTERREERLLARGSRHATAASEVVAVVAGEGNRALFESTSGARRSSRAASR